MEELNPTVEKLASLAMEIESADAQIDWARLNATRDQVYKIMANNVFEQFNNMEDQDEAAVVALATIVKLLVENLAIKSQLQS
jgi:hypothetical protein